MEFHDPNFKTIKFIDLMVSTGENYLRKKGFQRITVPRIVPASGACENIDTLFEIGVDKEAQVFYVPELMATTYGMGSIRKACAKAAAQWK